MLAQLSQRTQKTSKKGDVSMAPVAVQESEPVNEGDSDKTMQSFGDTDSKNGPLNCANSQFSSISYVEDDMEVTKFIDTIVTMEGEILSDTPIKRVDSASSLKITSRSNRDALTITSLCLE